MDKLSPELQRWRSSNTEADSRTVVLRVAYAKDTQAAVGELGQAGVQVESAGPGTIIAVCKREKLDALLLLPWVLAVEAPKRMFPKL